MNENKPEKYLIGALISDPESVIGIAIRNGVRKDWFVHPYCRSVWEFVEKSEPADCAIWNLYGKWDAQVEMYLEDAVSEALPAHIEAYIKALRQQWQERTVVRIGKELAAGGKGFEDVSRLVLQAHAAFTESEFKTAVEVAGEVIESVRKVSEGECVTGLASVFEVVNDDWGGYQPGKLYVIGARPSVGKSTYLRQEALSCLYAGKKVGMCALEMDEGEIRRLMACNRLSLDEFRLRNGLTGAGDRNRWEQEIMRQAKMPLFINDDGGQSADQVRAWAVQQKAREGLDILIVDYLQQMSHKTGNGMREGVGETCNALRLLAKDLNIPVIIASQLTRAVEEKERPNLHHLKETGNIEADAYGVMLIHRPGAKDSLDYEFINAKNRGGKVGTLQHMEMNSISWTFVERRVYHGQG